MAWTVRAGRQAGRQADKTGSKKRVNDTGSQMKKNANEAKSKQATKVTPTDRARLPWRLASFLGFYLRRRGILSGCICCCYHHAILCPVCAASLAIISPQTVATRTLSHPVSLLPTWLASMRSPTRAPCLTLPSPCCLSLFPWGLHLDSHRNHTHTHNQIQNLTST